MANGSTLAGGAALFSWGGAAKNLTLRDFTFDVNNMAVTGTGLATLMSFQEGSPTVRSLSIIHVGTPTAPAQLYVMSCAHCQNWVVEDNYIQLTTASQTVQTKGIAEIAAAFLQNVGGSIRNNTLVNTNMLLNCVSQYTITGNDVSGWGVGAGIGLGFVGTNCNSSNNTISNNSLHDSQPNQDMFSIAPNGIENWGDRTVIQGNRIWNNAGAAVANGGQNSIISGNEAWDNNVALTAGGGAAYGANRSSATVNADGSTYIGNKAWDSGVGRQNYGFADQTLVNNITVLNNDFSRVVTAPYLINSSSTTVNKLDPLFTSAMTLTKLGSAPAAGPGAGIVKVFAVAGTNAGSCKIQAQAGTSATPVTLADNIGSGC